MTDIDKAKELLNEFGSIVNSIYGVYLDSTRGFYLLSKALIDEQKQAIQLLKKTNPELANLEHLDKQKSYYGRGDPNKPDSVFVQVSTQAEQKARNEDGGANYKFNANMCLVSLYQYWEDEYRGKIEQALGLEKNSVQADIMGDIRWLRESIIHNKAITSKKIRKCKVLKWFKKGDEIFIDKNMFEEMIYHIYKFIEEFSQKYCVASSKGSGSATHSKEVNAHEVVKKRSKFLCWLKKNKYQVIVNPIVTVVAVLFAFWLAGWRERETLDTATKQRLHLVVLEASYNSSTAKEIFGDYAKLTDPNKFRINIKRLDSVAATEAFQDANVLALLSRNKVSLLKSYMDKISELNRIQQIHQRILESMGYKTSKTEKDFRSNICNKAAEAYAVAIVLQNELDKYFDQTLYYQDENTRINERKKTIQEKALNGEWLPPQRRKKP